MMPRYTILVLMLAFGALPSMAQSTPTMVPSLKGSGNIPLFSMTGRTIRLERGVQIEITRTGQNGVQSKAFELADSLAFIIDYKSFMEKIQYEYIMQNMDTLVTDYRLRLANMEEQLKLYDDQLRLEQETLDSLQVISAVKDQIALDAIDTINSYRRRGLFIGAALGLLGGALWVRKEDAGIWKVAKPIGGVGAGFFWSFSVFK